MLSYFTYLAGNSFWTKLTKVIMEELQRPPVLPVDEEDDDLTDMEEEQLTQQIEKPLADIIAYVDVRSGTNSTINTGKSISDRLMTLGATIAPRLTKDVTHIIFKDGKSNLDRVDGRNVFLVNPLWVDGCMRCNERISEAKYPVTSVKNERMGPRTPIVLGRIKRVKSMQPKPFEEEVARSVERNRKRIRDGEKRDSVSGVKKPLHCPYEFLLTDEEDNQDKCSSGHSRGSTPELPPVNFSTAEKPHDCVKENPTETKPVKPDSETRTSSNSTKRKTKKSRKRKQKVISKGAQNEFVEDIECDKDEQNGQGPESLLKPDPTRKKRPSLLKEKKTVLKEKRQASLTITKASKVKKTLSTLVNKENRLEEENVTTEAPLSEQLPVKVEGMSRFTGRRKSRHSFEKKKPGIVMTSVQPEDQEIMLAVVDKLGGFQFSRTVEDNTTHVVCGATRRTVNVLAGTAKGCWILSVDWVWKSLESGKWLPEGAFEMVSEFPAAQFFRLEHQQAGLLYRPILFHQAGSIYISHNTKPPPQQLEKLLTLAGAKLTASKRKAEVCIGMSGLGGGGEGMAVVSESWIIESISEHVMLPIDDFLIDDNGIPIRAESPEL